MDIKSESKPKSNIEEPIDPGLPICDAHHHLWDRPGNQYFIHDFLQDISSGHNIVKTVFVECRAMYRPEGSEEMRPVGETEFVRRSTARSITGKGGIAQIAAGIVGFADLTLGKAVEPVLEAHIAAGEGRFRGIRHSSAWDASPDVQSSVHPPKNLLLKPSFRKGFACLRKYDLTFDAWLYFPQLRELVDLAKSFPDIVIILDHIGGLIHIGPYSGRRDEVFQTWKSGISELALCLNVMVKLGGLGLPRCGFGWQERAIPPDSTELAEAMSPYYLWCIEKFGVNRCMFESNFPVDKVSYSYVNLWNAFKLITKDFSTQDKAALFHDTATKIYRL